MKVYEILNEWGRIVKGVNTTVDVDTNEIKTQAAKFGNTVDKDGKPPTLSSKVKGSKTNVLYNLGLTEGVMLKFQRGEDFDTLHIKPKGKNRVELRGKPGYERGNYDAQDKLHQVLDRLGKAANFAELMNGETVSINPKHPDGERATKTAQDILSTESEDVTEGLWNNIKRSVAGAALDKVGNTVNAVLNDPQFNAVLDNPELLLKDPSFQAASDEEKEQTVNMVIDLVQKRARGKLTLPAGWKDQVLANIGENFADGKVSGNSRPGRVARAGASCNGSVTDLRKRAKNASGERAKMLHWCANMKAGRQK